GYFAWGLYSAHKQAKDTIAQAPARLADLKKDAGEKKADEFAKDDLAKAQAKEKEADTLRDAGKTGDAAEAYRATFALYETAIQKAEKNSTGATLEAMKRALEEATRKLEAQRSEATKEQEAESAKRADEIKKADEARVQAAQKEAAELKQQLAGQKT